MKGAGGEQKGGGWEEEEEGEGVLTNRLWCPHKDWPRTEGENREVGGNWVGGRGDPLLTCSRDRPPPGSRCAGWRGHEHPSRSLLPCPSFPTLNRYGPPPSSSLSSSSASFTPGLEWLCLLSHARHPLVCSPTPPRGPPYLVSPLPRAVSIPDVSGALLSPSRAAAPDCPNAILESLAPAESCVWTSRAAAPKPRGGEAGRSAGRSPDTRDPAAAQGPRGARPVAEVPLRLAFRGSQTRLERSWGSAPRRGLRPRALHMHQHPPGRLSVRPAGEGDPVPRRAWRVRAVTSPPRGGIQGGRK